MSRRASAADRAPWEEGARRVRIENVRPVVDGGAYPIKRTPGESVVVTADVFADGHDKLAVVLLWRPDPDSVWREVAMAAEPNDVWRAAFPVEGSCTHEYTVEAWIDRFASWRDELQKKSAVGEDVSSELLEGAALIEQALERSGPAGEDPGAVAALRDTSVGLRADGDREGRVALALEPALLERMGTRPDREDATRFVPVLRVGVARERARFGAWYEMFPRSCGDSPDRSGTLDDAAKRLPAIAAMGFDVVYLPPIHPIGKTFRKGPNNSLAAGPGDPGSPWAIGSDDGGHTAVHPELGTLDDLDRLVAAARDAKLEIALDLAYQCSPDHPWVREHPGWFRHRPDGSIKYAENPPKKYQDIYPLDFDCEDRRGLWNALRDVVLFWAERGVRIFRVDNPHTKSLPFWEWMIANVRERFPDTLFLAEAFTRPKLMYALAKLGFDQSYTYFTWRNTRAELTEYLSDLSRPPVSDFMRPNFFANTPDILPEYLQFGGRPGFQVRLVLAATLSATYGIYSGFELCEAAAVPGTEEYLDSEKFQLRRRDWNAPGNLVPYISRINAIRRAHTPLQFQRGLRFLEMDNEQILCFAKTDDALGELIVVAVNLDPHHPHEGWVELPIGDWGIAADESYQVHDLIGEGRYLWTGSRNFIRLDPHQSPAQIFRVRRRVRTEKDFDYFA